MNLFENIGNAISSIVSAVANGTTAIVNVVAGTLKNIVSSIVRIFR